MIKKILSEPKTFEELITYWAWKKIDLERMIKALSNAPKTGLYEWDGPVKDALMTRVAQLALIESLQKRHRYGEF